MLIFIEIENSFLRVDHHGHCSNLLSLFQMANQIIMK